MGLPVTNPFCVPFFLFVGNKFYSAFLTFTEFQKADSNNCFIKEGRDVEMKVKQQRKNGAAMGKCPSSSSRNTHNITFEFCRN